MATKIEAYLLLEVGSEWTRALGRKVEGAFYVSVAIGKRSSSKKK